MSVLTEARHGIADALRQALPDTVGVWAAPADTPTAPCATVLAGPAVRVAPCLYDYVWTVELLGPGGYNEAGVAALEDMCQTVLAVLDTALPAARVGVDAPDLAHMPGGASLLAQTVTVVAAVTINPGG